MKVLICVAVASFVALAQSTVAQGANITLPLTYPGQVLQDGSQTCPSEEQVERVRNEVDNATLSLLLETVVPLLQTQLPTRPPAEQNFSCGGSTGWRRVAYLNMSDPSQQCPSVWREITTPHRVCGRRSPTHSCEGVNYTTGSEQYNQVCGRIIGYQIGSPEALYFASIGTSINTYYVDGISVTRGSPRQHVWTFACGIDEVHTGGSCPCVAGSSQARQNYIPLFIGRNYFCESGKTSGFTDGSILMVIPFGMDRGMVPLAPVAPSTRHHGSMYDCLSPQLMTLRSESVVVMEELVLKMSQYNSLNFM